MSSPTAVASTGFISLALCLVVMAEITDPLAYPLLAARLGQSSAHLLSSSVAMVNARFAFFAVQLGIGAYWAIRLLLALS